MDASGEVIMVTACRREESSLEPLTAVSAQTLEERQIQWTADLERLTPGLQFTLGYAEKICARSRNWFVQVSAEF